MQAVVLAAGGGTRLRPVTSSRSKAMIPVLGCPLVERVMAALAPAVVREWILVVAPGDLEIRRHFERGTRVAGRVRFVVQPSPLGAAHALALAMPLIEGPFLVSACDSLPEPGHVLDLVAASAGADAVLSLMEVGRDAVSRSSAVVIEAGRVRRIVEKPAPGNAPSGTASLPLYLFSPKIMPLFAQVRASARGERETQDAIQALIDGGGRVVGVTTERRRQVTSREDLLRLNLEALRAEPASATVAESVLPPSTRLRSPVRIEPDCEIGEGTRIGPDVYLESGCRVGDRARLCRAVVLRDARVGAGAMVEDALIASQP